MEKTSLIVAVLFASVLAGLFLKFNLTMPITGVSESFMQKPIGAPAGGGSEVMGPYDGIVMNSTEQWAKLAPYDLSRSDPRQMNFLVNNRVGPDCCPSAFTSDTGCVCLSEADKTFMGHRGGNRA
jgi:hypothetical protein